ncbi:MULTISPECIES: DUF3099 domain-containing protein [unclassified Streptomyces]|uniref:DUF3099 domain-containing protein n=1 Tax=unclassified Streptomyces TaxID=2593676 RepID=UPI002254DFF4|nr:MULTISPECIES: DUF3099 domain-containing protein [unclassified Streptomyces]MCX5335432.1 DUF3099 domain-containing protein [Streptomyces sp. NBC_00140]MCX5338178.1 DUF3099 domain-containing protein [Streptomyces sp. NBC_00140]MCX5367432.1 DUF3099 domain-containing protein [Streptomyces sp. NBC_00124]
MSRTARHRDEPRAASITRARPGLTQDLRGRQRRYVTAMLVRTACVVVMALTWNRWPAVAVCALAGGVLIPYVAVVVAQAGWRQQRGVRPELARPVTEPAEPAPRVVLEPTLVLPPEQNTAA